MAAVLIAPVRCQIDQQVERPPPGGVQRVHVEVDVGVEETSVAALVEATAVEVRVDEDLIAAHRSQEVTEVGREHGAGEAPAAVPGALDAGQLALVAEHVVAGTRHGVDGRKLGEQPLGESRLEEVVEDDEGEGRRGDELLVQLWHPGEMSRVERLCGRCLAHGAARLPPRRALACSAASRRTSRTMVAVLSQVKPAEWPRPLARRWEASAGSRRRASITAKLSTSPGAAERAAS